VDRERWTGVIRECIGVGWGGGLWVSDGDAAGPGLLLLDGSN
jgi:hypothetical protein